MADSATGLRLVQVPRLWLSRAGDQLDGVMCACGTSEAGFGAGPRMARLKAIKNAVVDPIIAAHRSRLVKAAPGDRMLVEFA